MGPILLAMALGVGAWVVRLPSLLWPQVLRGGRQGAEALTGWPRIVWQLSQQSGHYGYELWVAIGIIAIVCAIVAYYSAAVRRLVYLTAVILALADIAVFVGTVAVVYSDALQGVGNPGR